MESMNRRQFVAGISAMAVGVTLIARGESPDPKRSASGASAKRTIIRPTSKLFAPLLAQHFPGYLQLNGAEDLLAYTAIIRNYGAKAVKGYTFAWRAVMPDGTSPMYMNTFYSRPSKRALGVFTSGRNSILQSGGYAILTPSYLCSARKYIRHSQSKYGFQIPRLQNEAARFVAASESAKHILLKRIGKIQRVTARYATENGAPAELAAIRNAEKTIASTVLAWVSENHGASDQDLSLLLSEQRFTPVGALSSNAAGAAQAYSRALSRAVNRVGVAGILSRLTQVSLRPNSAYTIYTPLHNS